MSQTHKMTAISVGKPGPGRPGEGKHKTGTIRGASGHPTPGTSKGGKVMLNGGMDPGTMVPHAQAVSNTATKASNRRRGSAFVARMAAAKGAK